jgi:hemerythrin-like domain-containing protein
MAEDRSPADLAAWMRHEHQAQIELAKVLREHLANPPQVGRGAWLDSLRSGFERFFAHLRRNFKAQETGGYLTTLVELRPTLSKQVEQLRGEHAELLRMAGRIQAELAEVGETDRLQSADLTARILRFVAIVTQHDQRENMLTLFVFNEDIGAGD